LHKPDSWLHILGKEKKAGKGKKKKKKKTRRMRRKGQFISSYDVKLFNFALKGGGGEKKKEEKKRSGKGGRKKEKKGEGSRVSAHIGVSISLMLILGI